MYSNHFKILHRLSNGDKSEKSEFATVEGVL